MALTASDLGITDDELKQDFLDSLRGLFGEVLEGSFADFEKYISAIAEQYVTAVRAGQKGLANELKEQLRLIAEVNRIRAVKESWETLDQISDVLLRFVDVFLARVTRVLEREGILLPKEEETK